MSIQHRSRKGQTYTLRQGKSKTGTPQYFLSMKAEEDLAEAIPEGYEIYENPNAQVFLRKIQPKLIWDSERAMVAASRAPSMTGVDDRLFVGIAWSIGSHKVLVSGIS